MTSDDKEAKSVTIGSDTISVRVLQVNNRKMPLSFFKQIPVLEIIDGEPLSLQGKPLGVVNKRLRKDGPSWHVVWVREPTGIYRCPLRILVENPRQIHHKDGGYGILLRNFPREGIVRDHLDNAVKNRDGERYWNDLETLVQRYNALSKEIEESGQLYIGS